jgi:hypothetical protein
MMNGTNTQWRKLGLGLAALLLAAIGLSGCIVQPAGGYATGYYAEPAPVYVGPSYYYGPRYRGWYGGGDRWHGGGHHWH